MKKLLGLAVAWSVAGTGVASAQQGAPPLWSGASGTEVVAGSAQNKLGLIQPGEVFARQVRQPIRRGVLAKDFPFGQGKYAGVVKAGAPLYGEVFLTIPRVGEDLPPRRKDDLVWCVAGAAPVLCFRWNGPNDTEYAGVIGGLMFDRAPFGNWHAAPGLEIREDPAPLNPPYEELMVLKVVGETGFVVSKVEQMGDRKHVTDETHYWDDPVERDARFKLRFSPVKNAKGEVVAARATPAP
ncbi:hypothetical protein [Caulobacter sp. CCG-8]|uniref:hypothetical protein n=1 Tax=Caulobacter sp. CCG-8 TaxID=3127958 RepID=UPI00307E58E4